MRNVAYPTNVVAIDWRAANTIATCGSGQCKLLSPLLIPGVSIYHSLDGLWYSVVHDHRWNTENYVHHTINADDKYGTRGKISSVFVVAYAELELDKGCHKVKGEYWKVLHYQYEIPLDLVALCFKQKHFVRHHHERIHFSESYIALLYLIPNCIVSKSQKRMSDECLVSKYQAIIKSACLLLNFNPGEHKCHDTKNNT